MRVFLDTSALIKKYVQEPGSDSLDEILMDSTEIAVAPTCRLELSSVVARRKRSKLIRKEDTDRLWREIEKDYRYFHVVIWSDPLEREAMLMLQNGAIKSLDAIQLASCRFSKAETFVTSDRQLFESAKSQISNPVLI